MKFLIMSDLHGAAAEVERALSFFDPMGCDAILLLGDFLNHGPRNAVPDSYGPRRVAELLNARRDRCVAVRGNCDCEADTVMFEFPCNAPYQQLFISRGSRLQKIFMTHGHLHDFAGDQDALGRLGLRDGDIVLSGHTHVAGVFRLGNGIININPGSTTFPRQASHSGFGVLDAEHVRLYDLEGTLQAEHELFA